MPEFVVDFTEAGSGGGTRVPEGEYTLRLLKTKLGKSSTDKPMLTLTFGIDEGEFQGRQITLNQLLERKNVWFLHTMLVAMGLQVPEVKQKLNSDAWVGKRVRARLIDGQEFRNRIRSEVAEFYPLPETPDYDGAVQSPPHDPAADTDTDSRRVLDLSSL
jgi:hypothetical protein